MTMKVRPSVLSVLPGLGMVLAGVLSILWSIDYGARVFLIFLGILAWIVSVGLKVAWAASTNKRIKGYLEKKFSPRISGPIIWAYIGLLTGIFECCIILLFVILIPSFSNVDWPVTIGFGIAFGAAESIILGLISLLHSLYYLAKPSATSQKDEQEVWQKTRKYPFTTISVPIIERIAAIPIHVFTTALIIIAFQQNSYYLFWISFFFKSVVDLIAAWSNLKLDITHWKERKRIWFVESLFVALGAVSIFGTLWLFSI